MPLRPSVHPAFGNGTRVPRYVARLGIQSQIVQCCTHSVPPATYLETKTKFASVA